MDKAFLEKLEKQGKLKKQSVGIVQIEALLEQAYLDIQEAEKICHLAECATVGPRNLNRFNSPMEMI